MRKRNIIFLILLILGGAAGSASSRPKTDVVVLNTGDQITCEIKGMSRGKLKASTSYAGTIEIEWDDIVALRSGYYFRVEHVDGTRYYGTLQLEKDALELRVVGTAMSALIDKASVVEITSIKRRFWSRLDGSLSFGFSYTRASDVAQLTFDWTNVYRTERNLFDFTWKTILTDTRADSAQVAERIDISFTYNRLLRKKWTGVTSIAFQKNDELNLARRLIVTLGTGASPLKSNRNLLLFSVGLAFNTEVGTGETQSNESAEAVISGNYSLFQYDTPKTDINTSLDVYIGITDEGRYRYNFDLKLRREIISDFFFDISYYQSFDSRPPSGAGSANDFGIVTSLGWSY